jgi:hypothetical protein
MVKLNRAGRGACIAIALLFGYATSASAQTTLLVCTPSDTDGKDFKVLVDFANSTVQITFFYGETDNLQANITDAMITFRLPFHETYTEFQIDRVTGIESNRPCGAEGSCAGWHNAHCQKGSQQF